MLWLLCVCFFVTFLDKKYEEKGLRRHFLEPYSYARKCAYFAMCTSLEAHQRLRTDQPCPTLSWRDLEGKVLALQMNNIVDT